MSGFAARRTRVLERVEADALLVTTPGNVRYLTGFTGSNGQLLLTSEPVFLTDGRYTEQAAAEVPDVRREIYPDGLAPAVREVLVGAGVRRLAFEKTHLSVASLEKLAGELGDIELAGAAGLVEIERQRKSPDEIEAIRAAQLLAERALTGVLSSWTRGTERELALAIEWAVRAGAEDTSFDTIVATGPHAALPHAEPRLVRADTDGVLLIDMGAKLDGYCSDMTRTYLGSHAPEPMPKVHASVVRAMEAAIDAIRPGVRASDVDRAARDVLAADGYADAFVHSTGHGVGLEIHEDPRLARTSDDELAAGMVVTVEPGVYLPGVGGVRVEDLVVVTEDGAEALTTLPRGPDRPEHSR